MRLKPYLILTVLVIFFSTVPVFAQSANSYVVQNPDGGQGYTVNYTLSGATISSMYASKSDTSLVILINSTSDGSLVVDLPRNLIDSKAGQNDDNFIVLVDDTYTNFHESKTNADRTLTIPFTNGAERMEIIGTQVMPEFGSISSVILTISIISIIAISLRSRFKFGI